MALLEVAQAQQETERLSQALMIRRPDIEKRMNYLTGETGRLRFASEKFKERFHQRYAGFVDNWCAPVVEAVGERMVYLGIRPAGSTSADSELSRAWEAAGADSGIQEALAVRSAAGRAFGMVSPSDRADRPRITFEHPELTIVDEDPATGHRRYALIMWADDKFEYATLYTPHEVWKFQRKTSEDRAQRQGQPVELGSGWEPRRYNTDDTWPARNPFKQVPIVELKNRSFLRPEDPISEISGVMAMQDAINLTWAYLLNALDMVSLPQRIITGADVPEMPILDKDGQIVGHRPVDLDMLTAEKILWINSDEAKPHEWSSAQIAPFLEVTQQAVEHIAAQTRTPPHYLSGKMVNTAAEALTISEAGLVSRARQSILFVNQDIRQLNQLVANAMGRDQRSIDAIGAGVPVWADPQYRSDAQRADALLKKKQLGYPMKYLLEQDGLPPHEIDRVMAMIREEQQQDPLGVINRMTTTGALIDAGSEADPDEI